MKFLLDQNAERRIAPFLRNLGHDVKVVAVDFPPDIPDHEVLAYAYKEQRILTDLSVLCVQAGLLRLSA